MPYKPPHPTAYGTSYTRSDFQKDYPQLSEVIERILKEKGYQANKNFWVNYSGLYYYPNGRLRKFGLATAIEFIRRNGYKIEFSILEESNL